LWKIISNALIKIICFYENYIKFTPTKLATTKAPKTTDISP